MISVTSDGGSRVLSCQRCIRQFAKQDVDGLLEQ
jgi:hypothetical protein